MNFGWNLFTATSNIKLVSFFLVFAFSLLCAFSSTQNANSYGKPLPSGELRNYLTVFIPSCLSLTLSISLSRFFFAVEAALGIVVSNCYAMYAHTSQAHIRPRKKRNVCNERNCKESRITVAMMGKFLTVFFVHNKKACTSGREKTWRAYNMEMLAIYVITSSNMRKNNHQMIIEMVGKQHIS